MNHHPKKCMHGFLAIAFLTLGFGLLPQAATAGDRRVEWLERPWDLRYILYVTDRWQINLRVSKKLSEKAGSESLDRHWEPLFSPKEFFHSRGKWAEPEDGLSVVLIEFSTDGRVKTPHTFGIPLYGKMDRIQYIALSPGDYAKQVRFNLGEWFMGLGEVSIHWAPGLCTSSAMPSPTRETDSSYLYGPAFRASLGRPTVGCREWAYQLGSPTRPYVDITSYFNKKQDHDGAGAYIYPIMGLARWNDERKPIIGTHEHVWYCFHDCPEGDKPGLIPDIAAWARKNGWPMPKPPTRIPVFPDPPVSAGTYP